MRLTPGPVFLVCCGVLIVCAALSFTSAAIVPIFLVTVTAGTISVGCLYWLQYVRERRWF
ncbi:hypothetical protein [Paraburkholderia sp. Ac-20347]|uniref:hypothetical protein n=1 Tax=Paraburkholderia sp. Ac-20347 TaxID=2703892 RepID=UPI001981FF7E|nr:hypothetical protein [Paraburkholderia sp. Ac-20347]MBN3812285.1 hypothetical protein [Paraburkholderia sp. Ac-20347]